MVQWSGHWTLNPVTRVQISVGLFFFVHFTYYLSNQFYSPHFTSSIQKMGIFFCFISHVFFQTIVPALISRILYKRDEFTITINSCYLHGISVSPLYNQGFIKRGKHISTATSIILECPTYAKSFLQHSTFEVQKSSVNN